MSKPPVFHLEDFSFYRQSFYANGLPEHIREHRFIDRLHKHDFYLSVLFTRGSGTHEIDFNTYEVKRGAVFMMTPGQVHHWDLSDDTGGYIFFHSREFYNLMYATRKLDDFPFFAMSRQSPVVYLEEEQLPCISSLFERILNEFRSEDSLLKFQALVSLCDLVYLDLSRIYQPVHTDGGESSPLYLQKYDELLKLIDLEFVRLKSPKDYAERMNMSVKHLNRICQETVAKTTSELINERVILEAKRLLSHPGKSVAGVADELGFGDPSYFIRFFKKQCGESPLVFHKRHL
jgi:AraC family transcriptional activator of pobA